MYWNFLFFGRVPSFCSQLPSYWWSLRPFSPKSPVNSSLERQAYWTSPDHLLWQHHAPIARQRVFSAPSLSAMMGFWNLNHGYIYIYVVYIYIILYYIILYYIILYFRSGSGLFKSGILTYQNGALEPIKGFLEPAVKFLEPVVYKSGSFYYI